MNNVLFIAYFFPPCGGGGVQRSSKFVKYLPKFNWCPYVLTVRERNLTKDTTLLKDIPSEARVYETFSLEEVFIKVKKRSSEEKHTHRISKGEYRTSKKAFVSRLKRFINQYVFQPDSAILWFPIAVLQGLEILKKNRIDIIYASGSPWTDFLIGAALKKISGKPLVVDLRDPWSLSKDKKILDEYLERKTFGAADAIIMNNEYIKDEYAKKYKEYRRKMLVINNGYDRDDFYGAKPESCDDSKFRCIYAGTLQSVTTAHSFMEALKRLLRERPEIKKKFEVVFIGLTPENIIHDSELKSIVRSEQYKPHDELVSFLKSSNLLLIILNRQPNNRWITTGKVYEYFASGTPILAIVPEGNILFNLIKITGTGSVVEYDDIEGIKDCLWQYIEGSLGYHPDMERVSKFDREVLTMQLVEIFEGCM